MYSSKKSTDILLTLERTLKWVKAERSLFVEFQTEVRDVHKKKNATKSPLVWNSSLNNRDLLELLVALHNIDAIQMADGSKMTFKALVSCFEELLSVKFNKTYKERSEISMRKRGTVKFLERLINSL